MVDPSEPRRWVDGGGPPGMEELLRAARKTKPTITEVGRVGETLGVKGAGGWVGAALTSGVVALALLTAVGGFAIVARTKTVDGVEAPMPKVVVARVPENVEVPEVSRTEPEEPKPAVAAEIEANPKVVATSRKVVLPSELELLRGARAEISSRPKSALSFLERHKKLYPQGILAEEREVLMIAAYRALGKTAAAAKKVESFSSEFPESPHDTAAH